jgi:hypothetical protein
MNPTPEQVLEWEQWLSGRPENIRMVARALPPWCTYRLAPTGQTARLYSYDAQHDGTVTITALLWREDFPEAMRPLTARTVFGLHPEDFEVTHDTQPPPPFFGCTEGQ